MGGRLAFWGLAMVGVGAQDVQMETNALTTVCLSFSLTSLSLSLSLSLLHQSLSFSLSVLLLCRVSTKSPRRKPDT